MAQRVKRGPTTADASTAAATTPSSDVAQAYGRGEKMQRAFVFLPVILYLAADDDSGKFRAEDGSTYRRSLVCVF